MEWNHEWGEKSVLKPTFFPHINTLIRKQQEKKVFIHMPSEHLFVKGKVPTYALDGCKYLKMYREFSWIRQRQPTPVLLPGNSHGRRSMVGCSLWGHEESDTTERLHFNFLLSCIGEGNGNPLQCSCLENPRDSRAWWAAVCGVAQSRTWLKWLSSSREFS